MTSPDVHEPGTATGEVGSSTSMRLRRALFRARRARVGRAILIAVTAVAVGFALGRATAPDPGREVRAQLERDVLPLVFDADGVWTSATGERPSVSQALVALQRDGDPQEVLEHAEAWTADYDNVLARLAAVDVAPRGRPVQRQFVNGVTLSRDAVAVLIRAAEVEDPERRAGLLTEVSRLRLRGEQIVQSGRAGILELHGGDGDVVPLPELPDFPELEQEES